MSHSEQVRDAYDDAQYRDFEAKLQEALALDPLERLQSYESLVTDLEREVHALDESATES